jgi:DNA helicase II / ATP-dependent DNA helicase PcrA
MNDIDKITENLNEKQLQAVETTEGYIRVVAGAGSGKTRALVSRYAYIVKALGISPANILCVTFTNKAAKEMKNRLLKLLGDNGSSGYICTYHGFCVKVLREDINKLQYPRGFIIMDVEDQKTVLRDIYQELGLSSKDYIYKKILKFISDRKKSDSYINYILDVIDVSDADDSSVEEMIFIRYLQKQQKIFALDFDDLMSFALYIFKEYEDVLVKWQKRLHYIQVDEMQDSSIRQFKLVHLLSGYHRNLFVVGDPDQTIYEWRGACPEIFVNFDKTFPDVKTVIMDENYRSTPNILELGNQIIKHNKLRVDKDMFTRSPKGVDVVHFHAKSEQEEASWIVKEIVGLFGMSTKCQYADFAILYRANYLSRPIEQALVKENIPYTIYGGVRFYERKEIKDILSYLRLIEYEDDLSFLRVINMPRRGLGKKFVQNLKELAVQENQSLYSTLKSNINHTSLCRPGAVDFVNLIERVIQLKNKLKVSDLLQMLLDDSGLMVFYRNDGDQDRLDNLTELQDSIVLAENEDEDDFNLTEYLQEITLFTNMDIKSDNNTTVKLMTIHQSKGLEFPYVFLCGCTEGILPNERSIRERASALEEERRLTYVAITRAEKAFYMTESEGFNHASGMVKYPSRFIFEVKDSCFVRKGELSKEVIEDMRDIANASVCDLNSQGQVFDVKDCVSHKVFGIGKVVEKNIRHSTYGIFFDKISSVRSISFSFSGLKPEVLKKEKQIELENKYDIFVKSHAVDSKVETDESLLVQKVVESEQQEPDLSSQINEEFKDVYSEMSKQQDKSSQEDAVFEDVICVDEEESPKEVKIQCPSCGQSLSMLVIYNGYTFNCPVCHMDFVLDID